MSNNIYRNLINHLMEEIDVVEQQINNGDNIINQLFQNQEVKNKCTNKEFINNLKEKIVDDNFIKKEISCSICMETFNLNEKCIELPCNDKPHYTGDNKEKCEGIG